MICIAVMVFTGNGGKIVRDLRADTFTTYYREYRQREDNMMKHPEIPIGPLKSIPQSLKIVDAKSDTTFWVNKGMRLYSERILRK